MCVCARGGINLPKDLTAEQLLSSCLYFAVAAAAWNKCRLCWRTGWGGTVYACLSSRAHLLLCVYVIRTKPVDHWACMCTQTDVCIYCITAHHTGALHACTHSGWMHVHPRDIPSGTCTHVRTPTHMRCGPVQSKLCHAGEGMCALGMAVVVHCALTLFSWLF